MTLMRKNFVAPNFNRSSVTPCCIEFCPLNTVIMGKNVQHRMQEKVNSIAGKKE